MIAQVELKMLERLKAAADGGVLGYEWKILETYPVDWDEYLKNKGQLASPAAWVTFAGITGIQGEPGSRRAVCDFGVCVAARNERSETAARHGFAPAGPVLEVGSYQLMLDAAGLLDDQDFGLDIDRLKLVAAGPVPAGNLAFLRKASMFALHFTTAVSIEALDVVPSAPLDSFDRFHANYDIPPFGNVDAEPGTPDVQIPADASADATDHLEIVHEA